MKCNTYELYEILPNGNLKFVLNGTSREISKFVDRTQPTICQALLNNGVLAGKYKVRMHDQNSFRNMCKDDIIKIKKEKKKSKFQKEYERIKHHLLIYGNTITINSPTKYVERLEKEGFEVKFEKALPYIEINKLGSEVLKYRGDWVITLISAPKQNTEDEA